MVPVIDPSTHSLLASSRGPQCSLTSKDGEEPVKEVIISTQAAVVYVYASL